VSKKVIAIIQARMGSTRLPGKSMLNLAGEPLVGRVLERVKTSQSINEIILAIPDSPENTVLKIVADKLQVKTFLGSENDLLDRYYQAAKLANADYVVRIPADNPTPQGSEIDRIINHHTMLPRPGFSSNLAEIYGSGYPDGIGAEIFDFSFLEEVWKKELSQRKREHVHLNFFDYQTQEAVDQEWCPISTVECPVEFARPDIILDVNTKEQYDYMSKLYVDLYPNNPNFGILDIIKWHDKQKIVYEIGDE
jgi:spore coat polysaccharide biosynthesis protein SpsF